MYYSYIQYDGFTALMVASEYGQTKLAGVLITRKATLDYQDKVRHHCGLEEWYDHRNMSAWETCQWLQCTLDPYCVYTIVTLAWCSNEVVPCTVYMHTIGYDNNVSP